MMSDSTLRPRSGTSAKALLLTILGEFVLPRNGAVWTSTLIDGLDHLGVNERNARQAITRLSDQKLIRADRVGRRTRWHLTVQGRRLLQDGAARIYEFGDSGTNWNSRWLVVLASVPEGQRSKRHQLRTQLGFAGFGFIGPAVAVSPHVNREAIANSVLHDLELDDSAIVLIAETGSFVPDLEMIRRAWNLADLSQRYTDFLHDFEGRRPRGDSEHFVGLIELVHAWRRFPFLDPEIPTELLPAAWPGVRARKLFDGRRASWSLGANEWFEEAEAAAE